MAPTTKETKPPAKDGTKGVKKDAAKSPAKGATKAPAAGAAKAAAKGATKAPVKGAAKAPAKGAAKAPAKGAAKAPAKGAAKAPAKGAVKAPAKGAVKAPAKGAAKAPAKGAKGAAKGAKGAAKAPAKGAKGAAKAPAKGATKISVKKSTKLSLAKKPTRDAPKKRFKKRTMEIAKSSRDAKKYVIHLKQENKKIRLNPSRFGTIRYGMLKKKIINVVAKPPRKKKVVKSKKAPAFITKPIGGEKNGGTRTIRVKKPPSYYPTEVSKRKVHKKKNIKHSLKKSLKPGVVCIIVAGPHKGKRVVFLKQLASGLCLITGPFWLNRCPLRRINQIYLIGTTLKLDLAEDFKVPERLTDNYFKRVRLNKKPDKKDGGDIFTTKSKKYAVSAVKKEDQKIVDVQVFKAIKKNPEKKYLQAYMSNKFSLRNHQFPHQLKF